MKRNYIYLACMTVCMFALFAISSCSNEMDMPSSKIEHLQKMKQLCAQYGWTQIEGVSQEEVDKFLLSEDYEKTKEFFEFVKTGGETINLTDQANVPEEFKSTNIISITELAGAEDNADNRQVVFNIDESAISKITEDGTYTFYGVYKKKDAAAAASSQYRQYPVYVAIPYVVKVARKQIMVQLCILI